jgi:hypothetical protein
MLVWLTSRDKHDAVIGGTVTSVRGIYKLSVDTDTFVPATVCVCVQEDKRGSVAS